LVVTPDELLAMVRIGLGAASVSGCSPGDADHNGQITVGEILAADNAALAECRDAAVP